MKTVPEQINKPLYGKHSDTGDIMVRCWAGHPKGNGVIDASTIEMRVEVWTSVPFGPEQNRAHCMEVWIPSPMTQAKYEDAYRRILGEYEGFWRETGASPDPSWKEKLAVECGKAAASVG